MDVLLLSPAPRSGFQAHRRIELPLGLLCPATPLHEDGYRVEVIDQFAEPEWEARFERALEHRPTCLGVTCMTGPQILRAVEGSRRFKQRHPDVPVVWGGIHASLLPEQTLASPWIDIVVSGEGEKTFPELVRALENGTPLADVKGISYKQDGEVKTTPPRPFVNLDEEPPVAYQLVDVDRYRRKVFGRDHVTLNTSRGCTFACKFCWDPVFHMRRWRAMSAETVLDQMKRVIRDYDIRGFLFSDDHFFIDMERAYKIFEGIVREDLGVTIGKAQIRADTICRMDEDFLDLVVRAGVRRFTVGVESGSARILELIKKQVTVEQVMHANEMIAPTPIVPLYLFMMGLPTETPDDLRQSIELADALIEKNPKSGKSFNIYTPYPGTELFDTAVEHGLKVPERLEDWASFNFRNVHPDAGWITPEMRRLVENLDFPLMFLGSNFTSPFRQTNPVVVALGRLYAPLARRRVRDLDVRFPLESKLVKSLGLFARQD